LVLGQAEVKHKSKAEFSETITPVSRDPSEIILICNFSAQVTFISIIIVKNSCTV